MMCNRNNKSLFNKLMLEKMLNEGKTVVIYDSKGFTVYKRVDGETTSKFTAYPERNDYRK